MEDVDVQHFGVPEFVVRPLTPEEDRHLDMAVFLCKGHELTGIVCKAFIKDGTAIGYVYGHADAEFDETRVLHDGALFRSKVLSSAVQVGPFWLLSNDEEKLLVLSWDESVDYATSIEDGVEYVDPQVALARRQPPKAFRL